RAAVAVVQHGAQDRGVGDVFLLAVRVVLKLDREVPALVVARRQQGAEGRVAVEGRQAAPHHPRLAVDQGAEAAIADDAQVGRGLPRGARGHAPAPSQAYTASMPGSRCSAADPARSPTSTLIPPRALTTSNPCSSVRSSPTNTGRRPRNGGSSRNAAIASPLSPRAGRNSTTWSPGCRW